MYQGKRIGALLLMGGFGSRFKSEIPKQFHLLCGKEVYLHTLEVFQNWGYCDEIVLVSHPDWVETIRLANVRVIPGGPTRQSSSRLGLLAFATPPEIVLIHDAVRPFVTLEIIEANICAALNHGAADTCIPSADTLVHSTDGQQIDSIPSRAHYLRGQTPQTFRYPWIVDAHEKALTKGIENATDDCRLLLDAGYPVQIVPGSETNLKITTTFDLHLAENLATKIS